MTLQSVKRLVTELGFSVAHRIRHGANGGGDVADAFHRRYYDAGTRHQTWKDTSWLGVPVRKCPFDLWVYQELIFKLKPDLIVETGTLLGGSAYYFASLLDLLGKGTVITVDIDDLEATLSYEKSRPEKARPAHPRITYLHGSSTSSEAFAQVKSTVPSSGNVLVVLDSDHRKEHVLQELALYRELIPVGGYIVVEDSNVNGHPVYDGFGPGPMEAIDEFLSKAPEFVSDRALERHLFSFNPRGYLRRIR